jgi:hypothetical protein
MEINSIVSSGLSSISCDKTRSLAAKSSSGIPETNRMESESVWRKTASKYDVRNITAGETEKLSQELYDAGEISLLDHAILSFDPSRSPYGTGFQTPADGTGRRDLVSEYEARVNMDRKMGDSRNLVNDERVLGYLERLDAAKGNPVHVTA